jgi:hypothetical protein
MKRWTQVLMGVSLVLFVVGQALAQEATPAPQPKPVLLGECAMMAKECNCTEKQQAKLAEKDQAKKEALNAWDTQNGAKLDELRAKLVAAEDKAAVGAELTTLEADRARIEADAEADILAVLTPEQQVVWQGYKFFQQMKMRYSLTNADQATRCRTLCNNAAKEIAALQGTAQENQKAKAAVMEKLNKAVQELAKSTVQKKPPTVQKKTTTPTSRTPATERRAPAKTNSTKKTEKHPSATW